MSISKEFEQAVESGNIELVRIMLKNDLRIDPTFKLFDEMAQYAESVLGGKLYDAHNGDELKFDKNAWNEDYLNLQMVIVVNNFSRERIDLLKKMIASIYKDEVKKASAEHARQNITIQRRHTHRQIGVGSAVVGAAAATAGIIMSKTVLIVGGAAIAVAGVAMIISDERGGRR